MQSPDYAATVVRSTYPNLPGITLPKQLAAAIALCQAINDNEPVHYFPDLGQLISHPESVGAAIDQLAAEYALDHSRARLAVSQVAARRCIEEAWAAGDAIKTQYFDRFTAASKAFTSAVAKLYHPTGWGLPSEVWSTIPSGDILDAGRNEPEIPQAWADARRAQDEIFAVREWLRADAVLPAAGNTVGQLDAVTSIFDVQTAQEISILETYGSGPAMWEGLDPQLSISAILIRKGEHYRNIPLKLRRAVEAAELRSTLVARAQAEAGRQRVAV